MKQMWQPLQAYLQPNTILAQQPGRFPSQASVLVLLTDDETNPEIIFTLRAQHLTSHPGEVAFPGGMWELGDMTLLDTALRESHEEIALPPHSVQILGACRSRSTRAGVKVTPFVGVIAADTQLTANHAELDEIFRVPMAAFYGNTLQVRTDIFVHAGRNYHVPAYFYQGREIWGFTAALTQEITAVMITAQERKG